MFNKIIKYRFWISGGIIFILGAWYLGTMLRFSGIAGTQQDSNSLLHQAKQCYMDGAYRKAVNLYEKLLVLEPNNAGAVLDLAIIYDDYLGLDDKAVELYRRYLGLVPDTKKKSLIERWIKDVAQESLGLGNAGEVDRIKQLEKEIETVKKENGQLKKEIETLSGKLYTIQADHGKEIRKLQEEKDRLASELTSSRIRIGKLIKALSESENSKAELLEKLEEAIRKEKAAKIKTGSVKK